jgi:hypothetical protein
MPLPSRIECRFFTLIIFGLLVLFISCRPDAGSPPSVLPDPVTVERTGLTGKLDPFEVILEPEYAGMDEADLLSDDDQVFVFKGRSGQFYIYPHRSLLVEVVNDVIDGQAIAVNYCPLTGTGMAWNRVFYGDTAVEEEFTLFRPGIPGPATIVVGSAEYRVIMAFKTEFEFTAVQNEFPIVMRDGTGTQWDIFGTAVSGPGKGQQLDAVHAYYAYARSWQQVFDE